MFNFLKSTASAYSERSTAHGISYIFEREGKLCTKILWSVIVIGMVALSGFFTFKVYRKWQLVIIETYFTTILFTVIINLKQEPVLYTVQNNGLPIQEVEFPSITICSPGMVDIFMDEAILGQIQEYFRKKGMKIEDKNVTLENIFDKLPEGAEENFVRNMFPGLVRNKKQQGFMEELTSFMRYMKYTKTFPKGAMRYLTMTRKEMCELEDEKKYEHFNLITGYWKFCLVIL